jgi:hypothetical protein
MPSTVGLAGLEALYEEDALDGVSDEDMGLEGMWSRLKKVVGKSRLRKLKASARRIGKRIRGKVSRHARAQLRLAGRAVGMKLRRVRSARRKLIHQARNLMHNAPMARRFATRVAGRRAGALTKYARGADVAQRMLSRPQRLSPAFTGTAGRIVGSIYGG